MSRYEAEILFGRFVVRRLFKRGATYYATIRDLLTGKILKKSTLTGDKRAAKGVILAYVAELALADGKPPLAGTLVDEALDEWLETKVLRETSRRSLASEVARLKAAWEDRAIGELQEKDLAAFLRGLEEAGRTPRTRNKYRITMREFFRWATRQGYLREDPSRELRGERSEVFAPRPLDFEEARRLLEAARGVELPVPRGAEGGFFLAALLALYTGLRRANVLGLRWTQVDLPRRRIAIEAPQMKGGRAHAVPIHPRLLEVLRGVWRARGEPEGEAYVLGRRVAGDELRKPFSAALRAAGLPPSVRWHDLRHSTATWLAESAPWAVVQALLGHSPSTVTWRYTHLPWRSLEEAIEALPWLADEAPRATQSGP